MECLTLREKIKSENPPITFILYFEITPHIKHLNEELWSHNIADMIHNTEITIFDTKLSKVFQHALKEREHLCDFKNTTHFMYTTAPLSDLEMALYITELELQINKLVDKSFIVTFILSRPFVY
jgi:S-adenosylmethionine synthetase